MITLSQSFTIEAAHTLQREVEAEASRRIHGHSYRVELTLAGEPDARTGMVCDLGHIANVIDGLHAELDHRLLDDVPGLAPATMENLAAWIFKHVIVSLPSLIHVEIERPTLGQRCRYTPASRSLVAPPHDR